MRHRVYGKHLGRDIDQRQALFKTLVRSLVLHGTIQTSETKAKAIKGLVDKIINSAKDKNTQGKLQSYLSDKSLQDRLIKEILPKLGTRNSGYTQLVRIGPRSGDQTTIIKMSLIGTEDLKPMIKEKVSKALEMKDKKSATVAKFTEVKETKVSPRKKK